MKRLTPLLLLFLLSSSISCTQPEPTPEQKARALVLANSEKLRGYGGIEVVSVSVDSAFYPYDSEALFSVANRRADQLLRIRDVKDYNAAVLLLDSIDLAERQIRSLAQAPRRYLGFLKIKLTYLAYQDPAGSEPKGEYSAVFWADTTLSQLLSPEISGRYWARQLGFAGITDLVWSADNKDNTTDN